MISSTTDGEIGSDNFSGRENFHPFVSGPRIIDILVRIHIQIIRVFALLIIKVDATGKRFLFLETDKGISSTRITQFQL